MSAERHLLSGLPTPIKKPVPQRHDCQVIDDLTELLSRTRIGQYEDAVHRVARDVLLPALKVARDRKLLPDHPCFDLARQFANKWNISEQAVQNHIKLACGYLAFPVILLLNPAPTHEKMSFDQMLQDCRTLKWLEGVLQRVGLEVGDVMILDVCTLLSRDKLRQLGAEGQERKKQAMSEAYDVTQKMLQMIRPDIIVSCQCSTTFSQWVAGGHAIARELCSSIRRAKGKEVRMVCLAGHTINVVQGYHPSGFINYNKSQGQHDGEFLEEILRNVFIPCAVWKKKIENTRHPSPRMPLSML